MYSLFKYLGHSTGGQRTKTQCESPLYKKLRPDRFRDNTKSLLDFSIVNDPHYHNYSEAERDAAFLIHQLKLNEFGREYYLTQMFLRQGFTEHWAYIKYKQY